jgi:DNA-binding beta-propeller fold protein YncE
LVWEFPIGARPSEVLVTSDRKLAYVSIRNENKVKVVDVSGEPVQIGETLIGTMPDTLQLTNDGKTLVVGLRGTPQMALMDTETLAVRHVTFPGYGISGHEWLSANGKYTFIALEALVTTQPGAIAVVDNDSAEIVDTWTYPGGPWPHGVFYEPQVLR